MVSRLFLSSLKGIAMRTASVLALMLVSGGPASAQMQAAHNFAGGVEACEGCHGPSGDSESNFVPRLNGQQADYIISRVVQLLDLPSQASGPEVSRLAAQLDREALDSIARYFSRQSPTPRKPGQLAAVGQRIYDNGDPARFVMACKSCHGATGEGHGAVPRLAGQHANYLEAQLRLFSSEQRENRLMHFNTLDLSDDDIDALVSYLAGD
jgi:cytochrome c553